MAWLPKNLRKDALCSLCNETIRNPKSLLCDHSFCCDCLRKLAATREERGLSTIECPECKTLCEIPEEGTFEAFPTSRRCNVLFDVLAAADECKRESFEDECVSCEVKEVEYRCDKCRLSINIKCLVESPSKNDSMSPGTAREYKDEIKQMLSTMEEKILDCEVDLERDTRKFRATEKKIHAAKKQIGKTVDALVHSLRDREANLMEHLDNLYTFNQQEHFNRKENLEINLSLMRGIAEFAKETLGKEKGKTPIETPL